MDKLSSEPDVTIRLKVKDHKLFMHVDHEGDDFEGTEDFHYCLKAALEWMMDDYYLEQLIFGEISNITIVLTTDDLDE